MKKVKLHPLQRKLLATAVAACFAGRFAYANPVGPVVVSGQASFAANGRQLAITNTPGTIINWQQFSIQSNEATRFIQQSASSAVLNRVMGIDPSKILGTLQSNGRVFLINPNGILFGSGAQVDVAGLVASTLNLRNEDFLANRLNFVGDPTRSAAIVNQGRITAGNGGGIFLVGGAVDNQGVITAPNGDIVLAAGKSVRVAEGNAPHLQVEITAPADQPLNLSDVTYASRGIYSGLVRNSGIINANSVVRGADGSIVLKSSRDVALAAGSSTTANGINGGKVTVEAGGSTSVAGAVEAKGEGDVGGTVSLKSLIDTTLESGGKVNVSGTTGGKITIIAGGTASVSAAIDAKGEAGTGGQVTIAGSQTGIFDGARVDASGATGGGGILVGGDRQGSAIISDGSAISNSRRTFVGSDAELRADAIQFGEGGKVIVWADDVTRYYGSISARGGANGGNGGFVETSGKGWLDFQGLVDTRAPYGRAGTLLLDPTDITISTLANSPTSAFGGGAFFDANTTPSNLNVTTLTNQLGLGSVIVTTASGLLGNGDITVNNAINYSSTNSLTLSATRNITVVAGSGGINNANAGDVILTGGGAGSIAVNESIITNGGNINLTSGTGGISSAAATKLVSINAGSGIVTVNAGGGAANFTSGTLQTSNATAAAIGISNATTLTLGNVALTGGGVLSVNHSGAGAQVAGTVISGTGGLTKAGAGTLTLSQTNTYTGTTTVNAGTLSLTGGNAIVDTGAVVLANTAGATLNLAASETIGNLSGGGAAGGNVTLNANTLTTGDAGNTTFDGVLSGTGGLTKQGSGTFTLTNANTQTGALNANGGNLTLSGANGSTAAATVTVNSGATLTLDNSGANNNNRLTGALTMNGGEFVVTGNAAVNTTEALGGLTVNSGYSTVTVTPNAATNAQLTFASAARAVGTGATILFRGTNLGATAGANVANINFTAPAGLGLVGANTTAVNKPIVGWAMGDTSSVGSGTGFVTYNINPGSNAANTTGIRPLLLATEYTLNALTAGNNIRLTAGTTTAPASLSINSLLLDGGTLDFANNGRTETITSGALARTSGGNITSTNNNTRVLAFGGVEAIVHAIGSFNIGANITGTAGLTKSGAGTLTLDTQVKGITGGLTVDSGTLRSGIASAVASQAVTVRAAGALDLNGFSNAITALTLESGATSGASVTTGAGTLTLGGNVTLNVNGTGATGATISGNLGLGAAIRTITASDGAAINDLTVSALISGAAGVGLIKAGAGTLTLSGANTYTGATTVSAGTLSFNSIQNVSGGASALGAPTTAANGTIALASGATLQYTGTGHSSNRVINLTGAATVDASGSGALTLSGGITAAAQNLTLSGTGSGTVSGVIGTTTGTLTKAGSGTWTLSNAANTYTGATTINAGVLSVGTLANGGVNSSIGASTNAAVNLVLGGGTLQYTGGTVSTNRNYTLTAGTTSSIDITTAATNLTISGAGANTTGALTKLGSGALTLSGANLYTGTTTVNAGTLSLQGGSAIADAGTVTLANVAGATLNLVNSETIGNLSGGGATGGNVTLNASTLTTGDASNSSYGGAITGTGGLTKQGSDTFTLTGANSYSGTTTISAGTLRIGNGGTTGTLGTGGVTDNATLTLNRSNAITVGNTISGTGQLVQLGSGTTSLTGTNSYGGTTTITAGTLNSNSSAALGDGSATNTLIFNGGMLQAGGAISSPSTRGVMLTSTGTIDSNGNAVDIAGAISGAGGLIKNGNGTLTVTGSNTYSGTTTIGTGTLQIGNGGTTGTLGTGGVTDNATLTFNRSDALTVSNAISGTGAVVQAGSGTTTLSASSSYAGTTSVNTGTLIAAADGALGTAAGGTTVASGATLGFSGGINYATAEAVTISGSGDAGNSRAGAIDNIAGSNTFAGSIALGAASTIGASAGTLNLSGALANSGSLATFNAATGDINAFGVISGAGGLTKTGTGTLTLSGANTYGGLTSISGGSLVASNDTALGSITGGTVVAAGANLTIAGVILDAGPITLNGGNALTGTGTAALTGNVLLATADSTFTVGGTDSLALGGSIVGAGIGISKAGAGTLTLSGTNTYSGTTSVNAGTLSLSGGNAIADTRAVVLANTAGVTLNLLSSETIGNLSGGGATGGNVTLNANTLTTGDAGNTTYSGIISGTGGLIKEGTGTFQLGGANTYNGPTMIAAGMLNASSSAALGDGSVTNTLIFNGGTLQAGGTITSPGTRSVTMSGAGTIDTNGNTVSIAGTVDGAGALNLIGNGTVTFGGTVGNTTALASVTQNAATTLNINGGLVRTTGNQTYSGAVTTGGAAVLRTTGGGDVTAGGVVNATAGTLTLDTGAGNVLLANAANDFGTVAITSANNVTLVDSSALNLGTSNVGNNLVVTTGGAITQSGPLDVIGTSSFSAGAHPITLTDASNDFTGAVSFSNTGANNVAVTALNDLTLGTSTVGGTLTASACCSIILNGSLTAGGAGDSIVLSAGANFDNSGGFALNPGTGGRFLVWSTDPSLDDRGGLGYNFKQYNATYGVTPVAGTGNGFLYTLAPTITPSLTGTVSKTYDGTTAATLVAGNYSISGAIDGDVVVLNNPASGSYDTRNVGVGKNVSVSGIAIASATDGAATVYGYQLGGSTANANIGTITQRAITVSSQSGQSKTYGADDPNSAKTAYSVTSGTLVGGDTLSGNMGRVAGELVGNYSFTTGTTTVSDGSSGGNYAITFNGAANPFQISQAALAGTIANQSKTYGQNDPTLAGIAVNLGGLVNRTVVDINGNNTPINDAGNVSTTLSSLTRTAGELVSGSPYNITAASFNVLTGSAAGNYSSPAFTGSPTLTISPASLTGAIASQTKVYGANDPLLSGIAVNLGGVINNGAISTWIGSVSINDTGNVATSLASLTRAVGEVVSGSPYNITAASFNALTGSAAGNYNAPVFAGSPTLTVTPAALTGTIANQTKVYGTNDPTLSGIGVVLGGVINNSTITTWNGNVSVDDTGNVATTLASLTRAAGEAVSGSPYNITAGTFNALTGSAAGNYNSSTFAGSPTLTINKANLTGSIANQSKVYGTNDPTLPGIGVNLGGVINNPVIATWNGNVSVDDAGNVATTLASLTRAAGETVSGYNITAATFNALTGSAAGNYNSPTFAGSPQLTITQAPVTATITVPGQTKVYGTNDPALPGLSLAGVANTTVTDWNGTPTVINDTGNVTTTLASLARAPGELVSGSPYNIASGVLNALGGSAAGNYSSSGALSVANSPTLTISPASLTGSIANQTKVYGADDPSLAGIGVTLTGLVVNPAVSTWNGTVAIDDSALSASVTSLARQVGENVGVRTITAGTFTAASGNYSAPTVTGSPTLTISPASLTGSIANQTKVYGADDPSLAGIGVTLTGLVVNPAVSTWNGTVAIDDSALSASVTSLARQVGENVGVRTITAGTFTAASGNYSAPTVTGSPTLTISPASLTGSIANQTKVYGADDPSLAGIGVTLTGLVVNPAVSTWNGTVAIDDSALSASVTSLARQVGENVGVRTITAGTFTAASGNYSAPTVTGSPTLTISPASLTGSIANQTKVYGADDPSLAGIGVTLTGLVVNPAVSTWNGTVAIDDSALSASVTSLARQVGENVGVRTITAGTFTAASGNYSAPTVTGSPTLTISPASLTGSIANQTKVYGADDPSLAGIGVTLTGLVVNPAVSTWNGTVAIDDSALSASVTSLARQVGENVGVRTITAGTFTAASGNYSAPTVTGSPTLTISPASLTGSIANQTKVYGADDPSLAGIGVTLTGLVVNPAVSTWNGTVAIDDSALSASVTSLARQVGENVGVRTITAGTFTAASGNYSAPTVTGSPTLTISPASLTGSIANQTKVYGADDPSLAGIGVTLTGLVVNPAVSTWNGTVAIDDSALSASVTSLARQVGENVGVRTITAGTFTAASGNYSAPTVTGSPTLTISPASLTGSIANQTKVYGADDPSLAGIGVTLTGLVVNPAVSTWNGTVAIDDSALSASVTSLARQVGENVGVRTITAGTFTAASGNYSAPTVTGSPTLTISPASLTGSIANQTKVYGADDPSLAGIGVTLTGLVVNPAVSTWNGTVAIDDSALSASVTSLARQVGENVGVRTITAGTFTAASGNYSAPTVTGSPTLTISPASLTGSIANQTKVYGADDPSLAGIGVTLTGLVVNPAVSTWNGTVAIDDSALSASVTSLARQVGENVGVRTITAGTFTAASGNYSAPTVTGSPTLTISPASLTGSIANQTKVYGADDPSLAGIGVTLTGLVVNPAVSTWNGTVAIDDSALSASVTSLARQVGENVGVRTITAGTFTAASGNYSAPTVTGSPTLTISPASLTGSIANQTKVYGADDPSLAGIGVTLTGLVVNPAVSTWNGTVAIDDSALSASVTSLARQVGENVGGYNYAAGSLALSGSAATNYAAVFVPGASVLNITPAALSIIADDKTRLEAVPNPPFSASYARFQFGETPAVLTGTLVFTTPAVITSPPGAYTITPSGQSSTNYAITYVNGTLTVGQQAPSNVINVVVVDQMVALQKLGLDDATRTMLNCSANGGASGGAALAAISVTVAGQCGAKEGAPVQVSR